MIDVKVTNHGTIFTFDLLTRKAKSWWKDNVQESFGKDNCVVEHRYASDIAQGMKQSGLEVA
jgi:hypothetical protein